MSGCSASSATARAAVRRLEHDGLGPELAEEATQRLADQHMIVDDKDLHRKDRRSKPVSGRSQDESMNPICGESSDRQYFRMIQRDRARAHNQR